MVEVKFCDLCIWKDGKITMATHSGGKRLGQVIHLCMKHRTDGFAGIDRPTMKKILVDCKISPGKLFM